MGYLFISYSRKSNYSKNIISKLIQERVYLWIDQDKIQTGDLWQQSITSAVLDCDAFLLLVSKEALASDNVVYELETAFKANKKIFSIFVESERINIPEDVEKKLPPSNRVYINRDKKLDIKKIISYFPSSIRAKPNSCKIFISYAKEDRKKVEEIIKKLRKRNYAPWDYQQDMMVGQEWKKEIDKQIKQCDIFIACFSELSVQTEGYVKEEYKLALEVYGEKAKEKLLLTPVRFDKCKLPDIKTSSDIHINDFHRLDYFDDDQDDLNELVIAIEKKCKQVQCRKIRAFSLFTISSLIISVIVYSVVRTIHSSPPSNDVIIDNIFSACDKNPEYISCGERNLTSYADHEGRTQSEKDGRVLFSGKHYKEASQQFKIAFENTHIGNNTKDPELLISYNNSRLLYKLKNKDILMKNVFAIGISSGFKDTPINILQSILSGVAARQDEFNENELNKKNKHERRGMIIVMGDDKNNNKDAQRVAKNFIEREKIIGVIGPYSSETTYTVIDKYVNEIPLVSPTSTATRETYRFRDPTKSQDLSWFFRPVSTTNDCAIKMSQYMTKKYKKMIVFFHEKDLYTYSFYKSLNNRMKSVFIHNENYYKGDRREINLADKIKDFKRDYNPQETILFVLGDAHQNSQTKQRRILILKENDGFFPLASNNTIFDKDIRESLILDSNSPAVNEYLNNMIICMPWHPSVEKDFMRLESAFKKLGITRRKLERFPMKDPRMPWSMAMSYDATDMLTKSIIGQYNNSQLNNTPTRQMTQKALSSIELIGLTGSIKLLKNDRNPENSALVRFPCDKGICQWENISN